MVSLNQWVKVLQNVYKYVQQFTFTSLLCENSFLKKNTWKWLKSLFDVPMTEKLIWCANDWKTISQTPRIYLTCTFRNNYFHHFAKGTSVILKMTSITLFKNTNKLIRFLIVSEMLAVDGQPSPVSPKQPGSSSNWGQGQRLDGRYSEVMILMIMICIS